MLNLKDGLMLVATFSSILAGILAPRFGAVFEPFPVYCMMGLLFFAFLSVSLTVIVRTITVSGPRIFYYALVKLVLLPVGVYFPVKAIAPDYALAALLLSGISTGVASPFFANLVHADTALVLCMVVVCSAFVPFSLPALVKLLAGHSIHISFFAMAKLLGMVIFIPLVLAEVLKRFAPNLVEDLKRAQYPVSLLSFVITNLGIFSRYSGFFLGDPSAVAVALAVSTALAIIYFAAGMIFSGKQPLASRLSAVISFGIVNNVLVLVFSSQFFGPLEPTVAAMYTIPFFCFVIPLRAFRTAGMKRGE